MQVKVGRPDGRKVKRGKIKDESERRVWETRVRAYKEDGSPKHLFAARDAWTLSSTILRQLQALAVDEVRFVATDLGETYEVQLREFINRADPLPQKGWGKQTEKQFALARRFWVKTRESEQPKQLALAL